MSGHRVRVWVRTSVLRDALNLDCNGGERGRSNSGDDVSWGWARGTILKGSVDDYGGTQEGGEGEGVAVLVEDEDSNYSGRTVVIPPSLLVGQQTLLTSRPNSAKSKFPSKKRPFKAGGSNANIVMANHWASAELDHGAGFHDCHLSSLPPNDLINLTHLHEPAIVFCLRRRYEADRIYTSTGPILLALNPFKSCQGLYDDTIMGRYWDRDEKIPSAQADGDDAMDGGGIHGGLPPHVYGSADCAFRSMMQNLELGSSGKVQADQSILVSGESGAGKTVTTKHIMRYLAALSQRKAVVNASTKPSQGPAGETDIPMPKLVQNVSRTYSWKVGAKIEEKILESNPILEAFGNARTVRNDNSSRFGKFIELQFKENGCLIGASIETYLLEKVRIITQMPGERNYHIFYELLAGANDEEREMYFLKDYKAEDFKMTNTTGTYDRRDGVDDQEEFDTVLTSMMTMGFPLEDHKHIFEVTSACLHASNLSFLALTEDESRVDQSNEHLKPFLNLLGFNLDAFNSALCSFEIQAGKMTYVRSLPKGKAEKGLEALIKAMYGALFAHIVRSINKEIACKPRRGSKVGGKAAAYIGVLDIFGFEFFERNSFEQLCINYCNEALQQQFNRFVFKTEQDLYKMEGIDWSFIEFPDNQDVLELIDKKGSGIIQILDDQCRAPGTTDRTFANDIYQKCGGHPRFEANFRQVGARRFGVYHYAAPVEYDTEGFVEKNRDELPREATYLLESSSNDFVRYLAKILGERGPIGARGRATRVGGRRTVGGQFTAQLQQLRSRIDQTAPHYIRCLKPNEHLLPDDFNPAVIANQLRCAGVLEAVRVSRVGYPQRYSHTQFVQRYRTLAIRELDDANRIGVRNPVEVLLKAVAQQVWKAGHGRDNANEGGASQTTSPIIDLGAVGIQIGKTKIFLRQHAFEHLERLRTGKIEVTTIRIQTVARRFVAQRAYQRSLIATILIQCSVRLFLAKKQTQILREERAATIVQSFWRFADVHAVYVSKTFVARWGQRVHRGRLGRARHRALNEARKATLIQICWRRFYRQRLFRIKKRCVITIQCCVRCHRARAVSTSLKAKTRDLEEMRRVANKMKSDLKEAQKRAALEADRAAGAVEARADTTKDFEKLQTELEQTKEQLSEAKEAAERSKAEVQCTKNTYELHLELSREKMELLKNDLEASKREAEKVASLNGVVARITSDLDHQERTFSEELNQKERKIVDLRRQLEESERENDTLKQQNEIGKEDCKAAGGSDVNSAELKRIRSENEQLRANLHELRNQLAKKRIDELVQENCDPATEKDSLEHALKIARDPVNGHTHVPSEKKRNLASALHILGKLYQSCEKWDEAESKLEAALSIYNGSLGSHASHSQRVRTLEQDLVALRKERRKSWFRHNLLYLLPIVVLTTSAGLLLTGR